MTIGDSTQSNNSSNESNDNIVKRIWKEHCCAVKNISLDFSSEAFDSVGSLGTEENEVSIEGGQIIREIFCLIQEDAGALDYEEIKRHDEWLNDQLTICRLVLADCELRLRYFSNMHSPTMGPS